MKVFLADFGSTFVKYSVYDDSTEEFILNGKIPFPEPCIHDNGRYEIGENEIRNIVYAVFEAASENRCGRAYVCTQMHGYLLRSPDGSISNYVSWRDKTGDTSKVSVDFAVRGTSKKPNLPFIKLYGTNHAGDEFFTLGSYISYLLTERNAAHSSDLCASGFYDAETLTVPDSLGIYMPEAFSEIVPLGTWKGVLIYTPVGDHQASYLGSNAGEDAYLINIGTATQISCVTDNTSPEAGCEARPYFNGKRLMTVTGLTGGDELFCGASEEKLYRELLSATTILPKKNKGVIGGGGGKAVFERLSDVLSEQGIILKESASNIGILGLRKIADEQRLSIGVMLSEVPFTNFPIILKNTGIDFFMIDCEHGAFDFHTLAELLVKSRLAGIKAIVRIGDNRREYITKLADMGASGFLLSMTGTPEDIKAVVKYAKYSPIGKRGISTTRAHTLYAPPKLSDYMRSANSEMKIYAQIETAEGVANAKDIMEVKGVDGVFIGPNDLSDDIGCIGDTAPVKDCISKVANAAYSTNKPWGIITGDKALTDHSLSQGVNMISRGSELNMLIDGCKNLKKCFG